jgi:hypothetical protein
MAVGDKMYATLAIHKKSRQRDGATVLRDWRVCPGAVASENAVPLVIRSGLMAHNQLANTGIAVGYMG